MCLWVFGAQVFFPVDPAADKVAIMQAFVDDDVGNCEQHCSLGSRPSRQPVIGHRSGIRQSRVENGDLRTS